VRPFQRGIVMHTLHHAAELRSIDSVDELNAVPEKVKPEEMKLAAPGDPDIRAAARSRSYKTSTARGCSDHRREDRRRGNRLDVDRRAAQGGQLDGRAQEELDAVSAKRKEPAKAAIAKAPAKRKRA